MAFEFTLLALVALGFVFTFLCVADIASKVDDIIFMLRRIMDELRKEDDETSC